MLDYLRLRFSHREPSDTENGELGRDILRIMNFIKQLEGEFASGRYIFYLGPWGKDEQGECCYHAFIEDRLTDTTIFGHKKLDATTPRTAVSNLIKEIERPSLFTSSPPWVGEKDKP